MNTNTYTQAEIEMTSRTATLSLRLITRIAGVLYLIIIGTGYDAHLAQLRYGWQFAMALKIDPHYRYYALIFQKTCNSQPHLEPSEDQRNAAGTQGRTEE